MWFVIITLTLCVLVSSVDVNKSSDSNLFEDSDNRNCDGYFPWISTEYEYLGIVPFNNYNTKCIQATSKSCATSHPIDFSRGAIELNVYLGLLLNKSGLKVTVFNENNVPVIDYELNRLKKDYTNGWNKILLHPEESIVGYINLKGCTEKGEIIVVDSYQYISTKKTQNEPAKTKFNVVNENLDALKLLNKTSESVLNITTNVSKLYSKNRLIRSIDTLTSNGETTPETAATEQQTIEQEPGESELSTEPTTKQLDEDGITVTSKPLTTESKEEDNTTTTESKVEDNTTTTESKEENNTTTTESTTNTTKEPEFNQTDAPEQDNNTITTESDSNSSTQPQKNNFWTPYIITLVAVGTFVVLSVTAISAYYCGKMNSSKEDTDFIMEEDVVPQAIIPRVKNIHRSEV